MSESSQLSQADRWDLNPDYEIPLSKGAGFNTTEKDPVGKPPASPDEKGLPVGLILARALTTAGQLL